MSKAELARIDLTEARISGVSFTNSNLSRSDLRDLDLIDADFSGTYMYLTRLDGADLSRTKGLTTDQLAIACGTQRTRLPDGISPPPNWPCPDLGADE
jgi:uncharacterized protein YjbI with pentapeptide repeats